MQLWKIVGLAGIVSATLVGVAAGTRAVQRQQRQFQDADPDELRRRLHARLEEADAPSG